MDEQDVKAAAGAGDAAAQDAGQSSGDIRPQEIYNQMNSYVTETENLITMLRDTITKAEEQLAQVAKFDSRVARLGHDLTQIDTATLQSGIDDMRKHVGALETFRDRVKADMDNVKKISEQIIGIVSQYKNAQ